MALLPKSTNVREIIPALDAHLDPDTLAAFAERSQNEREEAAVFAHLAECESCREFLAVNAELNDFHWNAGKPRQHSRLQSIFVARSLRTAAGIAFAVVTLWWLFPSRPSLQNVLVPTSRVAFNEVHVPHIERSWGNVSLQRISPGDRPKERNIHRLFKEVTLANFSIEGASSTGHLHAPASDQIALTTPLGERWITVKGFWGVPSTGVQQ